VGGTEGVPEGKFVGDIEGVPVGEALRNVLHLPRQVSRQLNLTATPVIGSVRLQFFFRLVSSNKAISRQVFPDRPLYTKLGSSVQ